MRVKPPPAGADKVALGRNEPLLMLLDKVKGLGKERAQREAPVEVRAKAKHPVGQDRSDR